MNDDRKLYTWPRRIGSSAMGGFWHRLMASRISAYAGGRGRSYTVVYGDGEFIEVEDVSTPRGGLIAFSCRRVPR